MQGRSTSGVTNVDSQLPIAKSRPTDLERNETDDLGRSDDRTLRHVVVLRLDTSVTCSSFAYQFSTRSIYSTTWRRFKV